MPAKSASPKKGQSSFLQNFNVKEVGDAAEGGSREKDKNRSGQEVEDTAKEKDWTSLIGDKSKPLEEATSEPSPKSTPEPAKATDTFSKPTPFALPELKPAAPATPVAKSSPKIELPPVPSLAKPPTSSPAVELPSAGIPKPPAKPQAPSVLPAKPQAPSLLPGQKKGNELGTTSNLGRHAVGGKSNKPEPAKTSEPLKGGLPSLSPKDQATAASSIPKAKPPVALKPKDAPHVRIHDLPAPSRKATTTGTIKKESIRLDKMVPKPKPPAKPEAGPGANEPEFSKPAIPLGASSIIPSPPKASAPDAVKAPAPVPATPAPTPKATPLHAPEKDSRPAPRGDAKEKSEPSKSEPGKPAKAAAVTGHKKSPKVVLPPVRETSNSSTKLLLLIPLIILLIAGLAFFVYWMQRETSVNISVQSGELTTRGDAIVVLNFAGKLEMLRNDYFGRRTPVEEEISHIKANLSAAKGDLAGLEQRKKLLEDALEQYRAEIPEFLNESQQALDQLWNEESAALSKEYDDFKESLHQQIEDRAAELGVDYTRNTDIDAIAVAVNAYRLALYGVVKQVNVGEQRAWAEELLQQWNSFEKTWREKQSDIKKKALTIKQNPIPKISEARQRIDNLEREVEALQLDLNGLKEEVARYENNLTEATSRLQAIDKPFYEELRRIPDEFKVATFTINETGQILMPELQEHPDLSTGTHFILVTAVKGDQEFWAIQEFEVLPYQTVEVFIEPTRFIDLKTVLEEGTFIKP